VLDTHQSLLGRVADVMIPVRHAAEKHGTFTNHDGRVQRVQPAVEPAWDAWNDGEVLTLLGVTLGLEGFEDGYDPVEVSERMSEQVPAFTGVHLKVVGDLGRPLAGEEA
jgi:assimilatory nitrate reductase catalytic subunit